MAKAGFNLIKNKGKAVPIGQLAQSFQISSFRLDDPDILENGFRDEGRDGILLTHILYGPKIIEVNRVNEFLMLARNSRANRNVSVFTRRNPWPDHIKGRHQITGDVVMPPIVATLHNDDVIPSGDRASQTNRFVSSFAASVQ